MFDYRELGSMTASNGLKCFQFPIFETVLSIPAWENEGRRKYYQYFRGTESQYRLWPVNGIIIKRKLCFLMANFQNELNSSENDNEKNFGIIKGSPPIIELLFHFVQVFKGRLHVDFLSLRKEWLQALIRMLTSV